MTQGPSYDSTVDSFIGLFDLCSTTIALPEAIAATADEAGSSPFSPEAVCNRVFALAWNAPTALARFTDFVLQHHTELAAYETLPVSSPEEWIYEGIRHWKVKPEDHEAVVERLLKIWNRFGGFRGTFRDFLRLLVAAANAVAPSSFLECRELTLHLSHAESCRIVGEMIVSLQPSIDAGRVRFDLLQYAQHDLPGAVALCYLWQMHWLTQAEITFPCRDDISAFAEWNSGTTPIQESAAFRWLGFLLQCHPIYRGRLQEKQSNANHPFAELMSLPPHASGDLDYVEIVEINAEGEFLGIVSVRPSELTQNSNSVQEATRRLEVEIGARADDDAKVNRTDPKPIVVEIHKAEALRFDLKYDRKHFDLTRLRDQYEGMEQRLTQREHEIFVVILDAQDCKLDVHAMKGRFLGSQSDLSEGKRKLNEKLAVFDLRIPDVRKEKAYRIVDDAAIPQSL